MTYFIVCYYAATPTGYSVGQMNMTTTAPFINQTRTMELIKENNPIFVDAVVTNVIKLSKKEYEAWILKDEPTKP